MEKLTGGTVMHNLSNMALAEFQILLPPIERQAVVVSQLDSVSAETQRLASIFTPKLAALNLKSASCTKPSAGNPDHLTYAGASDLMHEP